MTISTSDTPITHDRPLHHPLKPDDQLCLLHIPKTAGSTLTSIVDANFHIDDIFPDNVIGKYSPEELERYRFFRSHYDHQVQRFFKKPPYFITILRDPIDRAISLYEFWKRARLRDQPDDKPLSDLLKEATLGGLEAFTCYDDPQVRARTCNRQVRQLAIGVGGLGPDPSADFSDEELLAMAKKNLDDHLFVGLTERFQDSVFLMNYIFGWYPIANYQSLRVASKRSRKEDIPQDTIDVVASVNQLDIALYEYGCERFQRDYTQMVRELQENYGLPTPEEGDRLITDTATPEERIDFLLPALERHYERCYAEHPPQEPVSVYDFNCLQPLYGSGWHRRNGKNNGVIIKDRPFRWTGPGTVSTMDLPLQSEENLTLRVDILNAIAPDVLDSLQIRVNGHELRLVPLEKTSIDAVLYGVIRPEWLKGDRPFTRIEFIVNRTASLNEVDPTNRDTRLVGLAIHRVHIFPTRETLSKDRLPHFTFPEDDVFWREVAEFLAQHLRDNERLAARYEFIAKFSKQLALSSEPFHSIPELNWVVVYKGEYQNIHAESFEWTLKTLKPVFANTVFVVFSNRSDVPTISRWSSHVLSLMQSVWGDRLDQMGLISTDTQDAITGRIKGLLKFLGIGA
ncbi:MAG: sulfotransferase family 2 domain-containing protein [Leptolyngbyaceae bacterium]|nr:sulfotransferase family 2 domain-containing protein [Leptolyngbyaceae bacterium]